MKLRTVLLITAAWLGGLPVVFATLQWPMTVTNIAELKSVHLADVIAGETAYTTSTRPALYVLGYYTPGDRGGGMFEWDPNASNASDGGLYFTTNGWVTGNGRWVRRLNGETINVKMWGAVGDGTTDDAPAIQQAIYSLTNGGTLYIPAGVYKLNATVSTGDSYNQNCALLLTNINITIRGDGPGSVLFQTDCRTTLLVGQFNTQAAGLTIEDIKFQGDTNNAYYAPPNVYHYSGALFTCAGIGTGYSKYLRMKNVSTDDQGKRYAFLMWGMDNVTIESCRFIHYGTTNGNVGIGAPTIFTTDEGIGSLRLINNFFDGGVTTTNPTYGADGIIYEQVGDDAVISGNTINNFKLEAIQCGAEKQTISDNIFRASWYGAGAILLSVQSSNAQVTIANNVQTGGNWFASNSSTSWNTNGAFDIIMANNTVTLGNKDAGIPGGISMNFVQLRRVIMTGNTIDNYADQLAIINGTGKYDSSLLIQGNSFTSQAPGGIGAEVGLHMGATIRNISILNNTISSGGNGPIAIEGSFNAPTNLPGRIVLGNNIYKYLDNAVPDKWVRVDNFDIVTASTNAGNYVISDLNPGPF